MVEEIFSGAAGGSASTTWSPSVFAASFFPPASSAADCFTFPGSAGNTNRPSAGQSKTCR